MTYGISFSGVVRPGVRIALSGTRGRGRVVYRGVPLNPLPDLGTTLYASCRRSGTTFTELMSLSAGGSPNHYLVTGVGPGYTFDGELLVSALRRGGLATVTSDGGGLLNAVVGSFSATTGRGSLTGVSENPTASGEALGLAKRISRPLTVSTSTP